MSSIGVFVSRALGKAAIRCKAAIEKNVSKQLLVAHAAYVRSGPEADSIEWAMWSMLHRAHYVTKGGKRTFAAVVTKVSYADKATFTLSRDRADN